MSSNRNARISADIYSLTDDPDERTDLRLTLLTEVDSSLYENGKPYGKKELESRLSRALDTLRRYDTETTPANPTCEDAPSKNGSKLPQCVEESIKGIIQTAQDYITKLNEQLKALDTADEQIEQSAVKAVRDIDETYKELMEELCQEINRKREILKLETEVHKNEGLVPLKACRHEVNGHIRRAQHFIGLVEAMHKNAAEFNREKFGKIVAASDEIDRLPEMPFVEDLPYISFNRPSESSKEDIFHRLSKLGSILRAGPVQIRTIEERPAGVFLSWYITDQKYTWMEQTFIVQKAEGEVMDATSNEFETVYKGSEKSCFVRDLPINEPITFRVRIVDTDVAWSAHRVAKTTKPCYRWQTDNKNYIITNNARIAAKLTNDLSTLFSDGPQFDANHVIEFKFLEATQTVNGSEGVALVHEPKGDADDLKRPGCLLITCRGEIFMDGEEKTMRLPEVQFGTRLIITAMRKEDDILRINIESGDRAVTYDWHPITPLYFAARFREYNKWNLMVK